MHPCGTEEIPALSRTFHFWSALCKKYNFSPAAGNTQVRVIPISKWISTGGYSETDKQRHWLPAGEAAVGLFKLLSEVETLIPKHTPACCSPTMTTSGSISLADIRHRWAAAVWLLRLQGRRRDGTTCLQDSRTQQQPAFTWELGFVIVTSSSALFLYLHFSIFTVFVSAKATELLGLVGGKDGGWSENRYLHNVNHMLETLNSPMFWL